LYNVLDWLDKTFPVDGNGTFPASWNGHFQLMEWTFPADGMEHFLWLFWNGTFLAKMMNLNETFNSSDANRYCKKQIDQ
jgi:hypothetical protein